MSPVPRRKRFFSILPILVLAPPATPREITDPDLLFAQEKYQAALAGYEGRHKTAQGDAKWKALYRACESEALLFRYGEAIERLSRESLPEDPLWNARFQILAAELRREFLRRYGADLRPDVVEGEGDVFRRSPDELRAAISEAYWAGWKHRERMLAQPLSSETYFVDLADRDLLFYPTQFDFFLERWTQYLLSAGFRRDDERPQGAAFLAQEWGKAPSAEQSPLVLAASLMEAGYRASRAGRTEAREQWRLRRILLAADRSGNLAWNENVRPDEEVVALLRRQREAFATPEGRAAADFEAARLLARKMGKPSEAAALCREVTKNQPGSRGAEKCERLVSEIELPFLDARGIAGPPGARGGLRVRSKNVGKIHFRLYRMTPEEIRAVPRRDRGPWQKAWPQVLASADEELVRFVLGRKKEDLAWSLPVKSASIYDGAETQVDLPDAPMGIYLALVSADEKFSAGSSLMAGAFVNITDLVLLGSGGPAGEERKLTFDPPGSPSRKLDLFRFYALDGKTGAAVGSLPIELAVSASYGEWKTHDLRTDASGRAVFTSAVTLRPGVPSHFSVAPLARGSGKFAYWQSAENVSVEVQPPYELFVETDRPIYRPGQKVLFKVTAVERTPQGFRAYTGTRNISISARDANGQEIFHTQLPAGREGSAAGEFTIPTGRLLGSYSIQASLYLLDWHWCGAKSFQVEEYKRPEFEVTLREGEGAWRFGREATVEGHVKYYFGGAVPHAPLTFKVRRQTWIPWFCWWWRWRLADAAEREIFSGTGQTDEKGHFRFTMVPQPADRYGEDPLPARFVVDVEARDPGGRTIVGSKTFTAGKSAYLFQVTPPRGFLSAGRKTELPVKLMNLNEQAVAGSARFTLHRLTGEPAEEKSDVFLWRWDFPPSPSLDKLYEKISDGPRAAAGTVVFRKKSASFLPLPPLDEGVYRLTLRTKDPWGEEIRQSMVLLSAGKSPKRETLPLASVTIPERTNTVVGENLRVLLGSARLSGPLHLEIWGGCCLIETRTLPGGGIQLFDLPIREAHKGGITLRWFGVTDFKLRAGKTSVHVPWVEKELTVKVRHDKVLKPAQETTWSVRAADRHGKPAAGEALVKMFDRSLEYYVRASGAGPEKLYAQRMSHAAFSTSLFELYFAQLPIREGVSARLMDLLQQRTQEPLPPGLRASRSRAQVAFADRASSPSAGSRADALAKQGKFGLPAEAVDEMPVQTGKARVEQKAEAPPQVRKDFSESGFFRPQLPLKNGAASFRFKAPEQLTSWKVEGAVHTRDMKYGRTSAEAATRKDLMVRVELPRFFREGDEVTLKAVVHNETNRPLSGSVTLAVLEEETSAAAKFSLGTPAKPFQVKPHGLAAVEWKLKSPAELGRYRFRAVARAEAEVDAEEREVPVLPARQRLVDSRVVALNADVKKTLTLSSLTAKDETRQNELLELQIDPQLALTLVNALPLLVRDPMVCVERYLNRYIPLAVLNEVYRKHPKIAASVAKLPKRDTISPAWDFKDPKRLTAILETPWVRQAEGRTPFWPVIDLFNPLLVDAQKEEVLALLRSAQLPSGAFPWIPGGRGDLYMTLYVLEGFSQARHFGVKIPADTAERAVAYVLSELPRQLKPDEASVAMILWAAYVLTSFPEALAADLPAIRRAYPLVRAWIDYADKYSRAMTLMGKAQAALTYHRLREPAKAGLYLDRALDGAREEETVGVYWQPEKYSWLWYHDSVESHAFVLRALQTLRPNDRRVPGMVQWLVFNRKGAAWKSTKASAAAIYTLLDFLQGREALQRGDLYAVRWNTLADVKQVDADDFLREPLRWTLAGSEITPAFAKPEISKKGPGLAFASLTHVYSTLAPGAQPEEALMNVKRLFYRRVKERDAYHLRPLSAGDAVKVGDEVEVQLKVNTKSQFEYVQINDPRGAGFEGEELLSGWKWDGLSRYQEPRDSLTNFYVPWIPHGEYVLRYRVRPATPGRYRIGAAVMQSMYSPEFAAHSAGFELKVAQ